MSSTRLSELRRLARADGAFPAMRVSRPAVDVECAALRLAERRPAQPPIELVPQPPYLLLERVGDNLKQELRMSIKWRRRAQREVARQVDGLAEDDVHLEARVWDGCMH